MYMWGVLNLTTEKKMIESKLKEQSRSQNKGLTGCRTGNEMNGFCLKQDQGLKGLDGQYTHTPNFSAMISSLPPPSPTSPPPSAPLRVQERLQI